MRFNRGGAKDPTFSLDWAVDAYWPGMNVISQAFGAALTAPATFARGNTGNAQLAPVGGTVSLELLDGRVCAQLGIGVGVNEQVLAFPASPRLARPLANRYVNPDTMGFWWEFSARFQSPGANVLAISHWLRVCNSAATHQPNINSYLGASGLGFGVGMDGAGNFVAYTKRLDVAGNFTVLGTITPPAGMTATDWLRWGYFVTAATPQRRASVRLYLENALKFQVEWDNNGTGTTNDLPDYGATSGNAPQMCLVGQGRSDLVAGVQLAMSDIRFRMGRYDINGVELPRA